MQKILILTTENSRNHLLAHVILGKTTIVCLHIFNMYAIQVRSKRKYVFDVSGKTVDFKDDLRRTVFSVS